MGGAILGVLANTSLVGGEITFEAMDILIYKRPTQSLGFFFFSMP